MYEENQNFPEFVRGEEVEVSDDSKDRWKGIYYDTIVGIPEDEQPYIVKRHMHVCYNTRKYIRKLPKQEAGPKKFTKEEITKTWEEEKGKKYYDQYETLSLVFAVFQSLGMLEE